MLGQTWNLTPPYTLTAYELTGARESKILINQTLPRETRGGKQMERSFLYHEDVYEPVLTFLHDLPTGKVTSRALIKHLSDVIFPAAGIQAKRSISL
jgi:hypothetical protein